MDATKTTSPIFPDISSLVSPTLLLSPSSSYPGREVEVEVVRSPRDSQPHHHHHAQDLVSLLHFQGAENVSEASLSHEEACTILLEGELLPLQAYKRREAGQSDHITTTPPAVNMKLVLIACLAAVAVAAPQQFLNPEFRNIAVLRDERINNNDGNFNYNFETENGISTSVQGTPGSFGQSNMRGSFSFPLPDGTIAQVTFIADENGYRAESPIIPAMPAHAIEQIRIAEQQRASGISFDELGRRLN
ncbi:hypothetical protein Pmani_023835 [Petrolisthes manimaculis]|uniref:Uncharacterized protein n=1 Tax=Petrolisthes manimaculis TaxID=1843537 RepID=A0AAE1PAC4_9EUCA|nr:hypothetical protein Pmani_023835 [Petrolisthes manimaculis]